MIPPGKTTLFRMQEAVQAEADRIAFCEDARVKAGFQKAPDPDQVRKRDDFAGAARVLAAILSDAVMIEQIKRRINMPDALATDVADAETDAEPADA